MDDRTISIHLSRILSGSYIFNSGRGRYKLIYPDLAVKYEADLLAEQVYEECKFQEWVLQEEIVYLLVDMGVWTPDGEKMLLSLEKQIEDYKVNLFQNYLNPKLAKSIRAKLASAKKNHDKLYNTLHSLDHLTYEGYSNHIKNEFIMAKSMFHMDNSPVFPDMENVDYSFLEQLIIAANRATISMSDYKALVRSDLWKNYWSPNKGSNLFPRPVCEWTDEQRTMVVLSKMYDSIYEHPDCPDEAIIADDDLLDGWSIVQRREYEKNKKKNQADKMMKGKGLANAKEVYLVANSKQEADNIYGLNDVQSANVIQERNKVILGSKQDIKEASLPDVQRDLIVQSKEQQLARKRK